MANYPDWLNDMWEKVNRDPNLRTALETRAKKTAERATAISRAEGGSANYTVKSGIRPGGRAFADVVSDNREEELGTEEVKRIGALRRAVRGE